MRKIFSLIVLTASLVTLFGCHSPQTADSSSESPTTGGAVTQSTDGSGDTEPSSTDSSTSSGATEPGSSSGITSSGGSGGSTVNTSKFGNNLKTLYNSQYITKEATVGLEATKSISRKSLASICGKILSLSTGKLPSDVPANQWYAPGVAASQQYALFGTLVSGYRFNFAETITRLDAARLAVRLYAAIKGIDDYNVEPGSPCDITDLKGISVEKQWYVYAALNKHFLFVTSAGKFSPDKKLTGDEAGAMLLAVINTAKKEGCAIKATSSAQKLANFRTFPALSAGIADTVDVIDISSVGGRGTRLATTSLQGLVNRDTPRIFVNQRSDWTWMTDFYIQKGYMKKIGQNFNADVYGLIKKYKSYVKGAVVFDSTKLYTINLANDIAAVENRIIIDSSMVNKIKELGITDIKDLTGKFSSTYDAMQFSYENYWMFMRRDAISWTAYYASTDFNRDYTTQMKIPSVWGP